MTERLSHQTVTFTRPFSLAGVEGRLPAGTYEVETIEELLDGLSFVAYRRVSTTIALQGPNCLSRQLTTVEPADLAAALKRDAEAASNGS